jgi:filamentous hemagglutinin family protein
MAHLHAKVRQPSPMRHLLLATTALLPVAMLQPAAAQAPNAAPTGGQVVAGSAAIRQSAGTTRIDQSSNRAAIDWRGFDVGRDHAVHFNQPSAAAWTLNRVNSPDPSLVAGRITANGGVAIVNPSGMVFAPGAQVNVGSLIASAANITNQNFMAGRMVFDGAPRPGARIENHGQITVSDRGLASLVAPGVANSGVIHARLGRVALAGAETYALDLAGDGMLSIDVTRSVRQAPDGAVALVTNSGTIEAAGGSVLLTADAARGVIDTMVRNTGRISADAATGTRAGQVAIRGQGGEVRIEGGTVSAAGTGPGVAGGRVSVTSPEGAVTVAAGARVDASGAAGGGQVQLGGASTRSVTVAGQAAARGTGTRARGGQVAAQARDRVVVAGSLDASGTGGGGTVLAGTTGIGRDQAMAAETTLAPGAALLADATEAGRGGTIAVNSTTRTDAGGRLSARGGAAAGDGGFIEISGRNELRIGAWISLDAPSGRAGTLLIDPVNIEIRDTAASTDAEVDGTLDGNGFFRTDGQGLDPTTVVFDAATLGAVAASVRLEATENLTVATAVTKTAGGLTLIAGETIAINANITLSGSDADFIAQAGTIARSGDVSVANGRTISLRADTLDGSGGLNAGAAGLIEAGPRIAGGTVAAMLPGGTLVAGTLRIGETSAGGDRVTAGTLTVAAALDATAVRSLELVAGSIAIDEVVTADRGLTLRADELAINAAVRARGADSLVLLEPLTPGSAIALGGVAGADGFDLTNAEIGRISTWNGMAGADARFGTLAIGNATTGAITLRGDLDLRPAGPFADGNGVVARGLALATGAAIAQTDGRLNVERLNLRAGGAVTLDAANLVNDVASPNGQTSGITAGGDVTLRVADGLPSVTPDTGFVETGTTSPVLRISAPVTTGQGGSLILVADDLDLQGRLLAPGGTVTIRPATGGRDMTLGAEVAGTLSLGAAELGRIGPADGVDPVATLRLGADVATRTADDITLAGDVRLRLRDGGGVVTAEQVRRLELFAGGAIGQAGGSVLDVATLAGGSGRAATLASLTGTAAANRVETLDGFRAGTAAASPGEAAFSLLSGSGLTVTDVVSAGLQRDGTLLETGRGGSITLAAPGLALNADLRTTPEAGAVLAGGVVRTDTSRVILQATEGGIAQAADAGIAAGRLSASAAGPIGLDGAGNEIHALVAMGARPVGGGNEAAALRAAGGTIALRTAGNTAAGLTPAGAATVIAAPVVVPDVAPSLALDLLPTEADPNPTLSLERNSTTQGVRLRLDDLDIIAGGSIGAVGGTIQIQDAADPTSLGAQGGGLVLLGGTLHNGAPGTRPDETTPGRFVSVGEVAAMGTAAVTDGTAVPSGITWVAAGFDLPALDLTSLPASALRLVATSGDITQAGVLGVATLSARASGSILLDQANQIARIRDIVATGGDVTVRVASDLQVAGRATNATGGVGIQVGTGRRILLVADNLDLRAPLIAPGGTVTLRPATGGRDMTLGAEMAGTLSLGAAELVGLPGDLGGARIRLGSDGMLRLGAVAGDTRVAGAGEAAMPVAGTIRLGAQALAFTEVTRLELFSGGDILQTDAAGTLAVGRLAGLAGGRVQLGTEDAPIANAIGALAVLSSSGSFSAAPALPATGSFLTGYATTTPADGSFSLTNAGSMVVSGDVQTSGTSAPLTMSLLAGGLGFADGVSLRAGSPAMAGVGYGRSPAALEGTEALRLIARGSIVVGDGASLFGTGSGSVAGGRTSELRSQEGAVEIGAGAQVMLGWGGPQALDAGNAGGLFAATDLTLRAGPDAGRRTTANAFRVEAGRRLTVEENAALVVATDAAGRGGVTLDGALRAAGTVRTGTAATIHGTGTLVARRVEDLERIGTIIVDECICSTVNVSIGEGFAGTVDIGGDLEVTTSLTVAGGIGAGGSVRVGSAGPPARLTTTGLTAGVDVINRGTIIASGVTATAGHVENFGTIEGAGIQRVGSGRTVGAGRDALDRVGVTSSRFEFNTTSQDLVVTAGGEILNRAGATMAADPQTYAADSLAGAVGTATLLPATLTLSTGSGRILNEAGGQLLASGGIVATAGTAAEASGGLETRGDVLARGGDVQLRAQQGDLTQADGLIGASRLLALASDNGAITQGSGARIEAPRFRAEAATGIDLRGFDAAETGAARGNSIAVIEQVTVANGSLMLRLVEQATTVTGSLLASQSIDVVAERNLSLVLSTAAIEASSGDARLSTGGALALTGGSVTAGGTVGLAGAGGATLDETVLRGGSIAVAAGNGDLVATNVRAEATGDLSFATGQAARLADVALSGGGALGVTAAAGATLADTTLRGGSISVGAGNGDLTATNVQAEATGTLSFATDQAVRLADVALSGGGALGVTAAAGTMLADTTLRGGSIAAVAGNGDLAATNVQAEATGTLSFATGQAVRLADVALSGGGALGVTAASGTTLTNTTLRGGSITVTAGNGDLTSTNVQVAAIGALGITAAGGTTLADTTLRGGSISVGAGNGDLTATNLQAEATGGLALSTDQAVRLADVALSGGRALGVTAASGTTLTNTTLRGGSIAVAAGTGDLAATNVQAEATGDLAFATDQAARLANATLSAGGALGVTAAAGTTLTDTTLRGGSVAVAAGNGDLAATNVQAEATADLAFSTVQAARLADVALSAGGALGVTAASGTTLADTTLRGGSIAVAAGNGDLAATNVRAEATGTLSFATDQAVRLADVAISAGGALGIIAAGGTTLADTTLRGGSVAVAAGNGDLAATNVRAEADGRPRPLHRPGGATGRCRAFRRRRPRRHRRSRRHAGRHHAARRLHRGRRR